MVADKRSFPASPAHSFPRLLREEDSLCGPRSTAPWRRLDQSSSSKTQCRRTQSFLSKYSEDYLCYRFWDSRPGPDIRSAILL